MLVTLEPIRAQDLRPGDLFTAVGDDTFRQSLLPPAVGSKVYIRTEYPCPDDQRDEVVSRVHIRPPPKPPGPNRYYASTSLFELMRLCYGMGWYSGAPSLFTVRMVGQFEGHGRASETWEHDFVVELAQVNAEPEQAALNVIYHGRDGKPPLDLYARHNSLPGGTFRGETLEEACAAAAKAIHRFREEVTP